MWTRVGGCFLVALCAYAAHPRKESGAVVGVSARRRPSSRWSLILESDSRESDGPGPSSGLETWETATLGSEAAARPPGGEGRERGTVSLIGETASLAQLDRRERIHSGFGASCLNPVGSLLVNGWCNDLPAGKYICAELWWCGPQKFFISTIVICSLWVLMFYSNAYLVFPVMKVAFQIAPSKYTAEDSSLWFAWHLQSEFNSAICVYMSFWPVLMLTSSSQEIQYAPPSTSVQSSLDQHTQHIVAIAQAAHIFMCFVLVDSVVGSIHKLIQVDMIVHHVMFVLFALSVTYNCFAAYLAGVLLLMEVSTLFLNYFTYFRNRLGYEHLSVRLSFGGFVLTFILFRLIGVTYIAIVFISSLLLGNFDTAGIPVPQRVFILSALTLVACMQWAWAYQIGHKMVRVFTRGNSPNNQAVDDGS